MKRTILASALAMTLGGAAQASITQSQPRYNTLTGLIPIMYQALDLVSRELVGFIPAAYINSEAKAVALNQTITYPVVPDATTEDVTPGQQPAASGSQTIGTGTMTITKSKVSPILWTGEEQLSVSANPAEQAILRDQFAQSFRVLTNAIEADLATEYKKMSRAYGTAGTTPFGTAADLSDIAQLAKLLDDNGAPATGRQLVLGTTAIANLRGKHSELFKVNESGDGGALLRRGVLGQLMSFDLHTSAAVTSHTKGTASGATTNAAGYAIGATTITLAVAGTGTILAGDVITFAGDTNKYVVDTGDSDVSNGGTIVLAAPGLRQAIPASTTAITVGNNYAANMAFTKNALHLVARHPAMPKGGDAATDVVELTDPHSGLSFQLAVYRQYRQVKMELGIAWGWKTVKTAHGHILLG